jgi:hypothetical protein
VPNNEDILFWGKKNHEHRSDASNMYTGLKAIIWTFDRDRWRALVNAVTNLQVP